MTKHYSVSEAAEFAGVSDSTIRRHLDELKPYGAKTVKRKWVIPEKALIKVFGLFEDTKTNQMPKHDYATPKHDYLSEIEFLRALVKQQQETIAQQAKALELHSERESQLEAMRQRNRFAEIEAEAASQPTPVHTSTPEPTPQKRSWFRLIRR